MAALDDGLPRGCRFLGSHPVAGSEKTGVSHAPADLFDGRVAVLTPTRNTRAEDFDLLEEFWEALGSVVVRMAPEEHDRALAITSHLPHLAAAALAATLPEQYFRLTGTGILDATRLAGGDPELWKQILLQNRENVLAALQQYGVKLLCPARRPPRRQRNGTGTNPHPCEEEPRCSGKLTSIRPKASPTCSGARRPLPPPSWAWAATSASPALRAI